MSDTGFKLEFTNRSIRMKGPLPSAEMQMLRAEVREGLSQITEIDLEFLSTRMDLTLADVLGQKLTIEIETEGGSVRCWHGHCTEIIFEGSYQGQGHYVASLRAWPWFLTQTTDCRIFQDISALDLIKQIFGEYGFSDFEDGTTVVPPNRVYCVQYRETDYDFIHRLMVEEGIYYYIKHDETKHILVLVDSFGSHVNIPDPATIKFFGKQDAMRRREDHIFDWRSHEVLRTGKVTLNDFNFGTPASDIKSNSAIPKGTHSHKDYEIYDYPGRYPESERGTTLARMRMEALAAEHQRARGQGNLRTLAAGFRFTLTNHERAPVNQEYLIIEAIHQIQIETDYDKGELPESQLGERVTLDPKKNPDPYRCTFWVQPSQEQYRAPYSCPRPRIPGLQTATVMGRDGDEIYTDCYGRIKVQFHWDREGKEADRKEGSSCWVRKAEPWTGKGWGMQWVPRVGQEVVVQFEEGDPDRPMVVGMLFNNATTYPPFRGAEEAAATLTSQDDEGRSLASPLPANMTMMGWTTRSTQQGSTTTFHELVFEDKKDSEFIRLQSERDYKQIIKNNAVITVGIEHADPGDYTQTIKNNKTETIQDGDHTFTVQTGNETWHVETNRTMTVNGDHAETIAGTQTIDVTGDISITSNSKITLTVGSSTITIDSSSIKLASGTIDLNATGQFKASGSGGAEMTSDAMAKVKGSMVDVGGDAMVKVQGGVLKLN